MSHIKFERPNVGVPVIDLFAGAGGMGIGSQLAGADLRLSVELDPTCASTLRTNADNIDSVFEADVASTCGAELRERAGLSFGSELLIIGGAPCQPFSKAAYWTDPGHDARYRRARANGVQSTKPKPIEVPRSDKRRSLLQEFHRLVHESRADAFLFENVPSIVHPRNRATFEAFVRSFEDIGYFTSFTKVVATEYGVPQKRERIFLLGQRHERPALPMPTHCRDELTRSLLKKPVVTAGDVLEPFRGKQYFEPQELIAGRWAEQLRKVPPGWNYKALTAWAGCPHPEFEAETRFWNFLLKLSPDKPSWTLAASPGPWTGPFHWESRRLRTVELAALQTFPTDYRFDGSRRERVRQIGNAVPCRLAQHMIQPLISRMTNHSTSAMLKGRDGA